MKKLIPAIVLLLVSAIVMSTASYAWFSMNRTVQATNMSVQAKAGPSLVISKTLSDSDSNVQHTAGKMTESYQGVKPVLYPATLYASTMKDNTATHAALAEPATKLAYVANGGDIDPTTGLKKTSATDLYYAGATVMADPTASPAVTGYYYDFDFYLAAEGENAIEDGKLYVSIPAVTEPSENALKATTVLVLVDGAVYGSPVVLTEGTTSDIETITLSATKKIPAVDANYKAAVASSVKVTLRVYVDGALTEPASSANAGKAFVRNAAIVDLATSDVTFNATFEVR